MVQCALVPQEETPTIGIRSMVPMEQMQSFFGESYGRLFEEIGREHIKVTGMPFGRYRGIPTDKVDVEAGVPIAKPAEGHADVVAGELPATEAVEAVHVGPYDTLEQTYNEMTDWMSHHSLVPSDDMWEFYLTDPAEEPDPAKWETKVVWPVAPVSV